MLYQLEVLEVRHIADLALDARMVRDRLLETVPEKGLGKPALARGDRDPAAGGSLDAVPRTQPAFVALLRAIEVLPRDIRENLWVVARIGRGDAAIEDRDATIRSAKTLKEDEIAADLMEDHDLHIHLRKGLYDLGETSLPVDEH